MEYTTHLSPSECCKRLANPTGYQAPEIKRIVNPKYISYFDGSTNRIRFGTKVQGDDFELFCKFPTKYVGFPDKPQVRLCGEILESETGGTVIKCHFKIDGYWVFKTIIMPILVVVLIIFCVFAVPNTSRIPIFASTLFFGMGILLYMRNWKILLDFLKDLLETRQSSGTDKTL